MAKYRSPHRASVVVRRSIIARAIISAVVITACVVGAHYSDVRTFPFSGYLYLVFGVMILLSFLYVAGLRGGYEYPKRLLRLQLVLDFLVVTGIVASTGGIYSVFVFLYIIAVLEVGILLTQTESLAAASCSSLVLGAMIVLTERGVLTSVGPFRLQGGQTIHHLIVQVFALYLTAFISSYWSFRLHKMQAFQRGLFNNMSSGFVMTDNASVVSVMNVAAQRILGFSLEEALGRRSRDVLKVSGGGADPMETTLSAGEEFSSYEFRVVRKDGNEMLVGITTNVLRGPRGKVEGVIGSFVDLTEIERMRRELRNQDRLAAVGELAAGLAHEIRNPVAAIRGSVEELGRSLDDPDMARSLADIAIRESDQLNQLVTRFLQFARNSTPVKQTFDLRDLLEETIVLLRRRARRTSSTDVAYCAGDAPAVVHMDRSQLKQALLNVGHNALEAMPEGGTLDICLARDNGADQAQVTFRDSGAGIPQDQMERIFEPFFTTKKHGFGMGLAVVQKIISSHGGSVAVSSEEREGTTVTVTVPLNETAEHAVVLASAS
jgi:two-component system sensor histidine kinase PilS (NtrC family)